MLPPYRASFREEVVCPGPGIPLTECSIRVWLKDYVHCVQAIWIRATPTLNAARIRRNRTRDTREPSGAWRKEEAMLLLQNMSPYPETQVIIQNTKTHFLGGFAQEGTVLRTISIKPNSWVKVCFVRPIKVGWSNPYQFCKVRSSINVLLRLFSPITPVLGTLVLQRLRMVCRYVNCQSFVGVVTIFFYLQRYLLRLQNWLLRPRPHLSSFSTLIRSSDLEGILMAFCSPLNRSRSIGSKSAFVANTKDVIKLNEL